MDAGRAFEAYTSESLLITSIHLYGCTSYQVHGWVIHMQHSILSDKGKLQHIYFVLSFSGYKFETDVGINENSVPFGINENSVRFSECNTWFSLSLFSEGSDGAAYSMTSSTDTSILVFFSVGDCELEILMLDVVSSLGHLLMYQQLSSLFSISHNEDSDLLQFNILNLLIRHQSFDWGGFQQIVQYRLLSTSDIPWAQNSARSPTKNNSDVVCSLSANLVCACDVWALICGPSAHCNLPWLQTLR